MKLLCHIIGLIALLLVSTLSSEASFQRHWTFLQAQKYAEPTDLAAARKAQDDWTKLLEEAGQDPDLLAAQVSTIRLSPLTETLLRGDPDEIHSILATPNALGVFAFGSQISGGGGKGIRGPTSRQPSVAEGRVAPNRTLTNVDFPEVSGRLSTQKQSRHIEGDPNYRHGGTLASQADARSVLDAYRSGNTTVVGQTQQGFPIVRFNGVTGRYKNTITDQSTGATRNIDEPSNVFIVKGTSSPSIVPANPQTYQ